MEDSIIAIGNSNATECKQFMINALLRKAYLYDRPLELTSKEFDILYLLVNNPQNIYSRKALLEIVWGYDYYGDSRTVDIHIRRLRKKIEPDPANPKYILTKWGEGYYYKNEGELL